MTRKKMIAIIVTAITVLTVSTIAWAATAGFCNGVPTAVRAGFKGSGKTAQGVVIVSGLNNRMGCANSEVWFHPNFSDTEKILSLATAAHLSGKKLTCWVSGCNYNYQQGADCTISN